MESMAVVPWRYQNPHANEKYSASRIFSVAGHTIELHQDPNASIDLHSHTGNVVWDSAYILAKFISEHLSLEGKTVLELGSGTGLIGISAWIAAAKLVILTDISDTLELTKRNVETNSQRICASAPATGHAKNSIQVMSLTWGETDRSQYKFTSDYPDYIFGSDIVYLKDTFNALCQTLHAFSGPNTRIFLAYKKRGLMESDFFAIARDMGFDVQKVARNKIYVEFRSSLEYIIVEMRKTQ
ncbi:uncharacterized protein SPPG_01267 [Spizellomyces punctatus DAOM BR117]|uniref:Methyltransferase small domain-containing protein n=1 Tax=Spizellomyces punctatus (strain DAOM BR117) TaxID=645134 RepID=A0A0L0HR06_SPIPD|nr:uncharacterized protein SPPG_01267 [Spizellomyces punctatus DAOM BR117]KND03811.1 hypothetical protein SPPG_01267 [Spizellomyces punctatus DAOM BR117]|eukprot:XP_016611850.1 hypothetical protein SPPG_01267 [Spizellomyces punctatus DAOM BR117]